MDSDAELYLRWLSLRDESAFAALARRHADLVLDIAWRTTRDRADAEDALQDALLGLAQDGTARPAEVGVRAWLARIAIRAAKHRAASERARERREREVGVACQSKQRSKGDVANVDLAFAARTTRGAWRAPSATARRTQRHPNIRSVPPQ